MFLGFILGLAAGVILMAVVQVEHDNKIMEEFEKEYNYPGEFLTDLEYMEYKKSFDSDIDNHIPKID